MHGSVFTRSSMLLLLSMILIFAFGSAFPNNIVTKEVYAHLDHLVHYNGREDRIGPYAIFQALDPEYARKGEPVAIEFSIQDREGRDTFGVVTMVEIYLTRTGERIYVTPWTLREVGDFELFYTFPERGNYQIVVSVSESELDLNTIDPSRSILSSSAGCDCLRSVFNVTISEGFGVAWITATAVAVIAPLAVLGGVLAFSYRSKSRAGLITKRELLRYSVMLSALAGGVVHLAVYSDHALLRLEYSIFLLSAAGAQIVYGVLYTLMTLTAGGVLLSARNGSIQSMHSQYKKSVVVNLVGFVGSGVLLGLYAYAVIFPPPLSPTDEPEELEFAGILAKSLEVFLVIGIITIMRWDKQSLHRQGGSVKQSH